MFRPGRELCSDFYWQAVRPILDAEFAGVRHSAGLIGPGSEVLGFDDERSADHHWGPRVQLFVGQQDPRIAVVLADRLPYRFQGWSTSFSRPDPDDHGVQRLEDRTEGPVAHRVEVSEPAPFFMDLLGFVPQDAVSLQDWLATPSQILRSVTSAAIYHDELGVLGAARTALEWYPHDVWLYLMACQWRRIAQEEHLMGRAGEVGDDLGSSLLTSRLVRDLMRLCFLQERQHAPYAKWVGTAFRKLEASIELLPELAAAMAGTTWEAREAALCRAYAAVARRHNALGITDALEPTVSRFHGRRLRVLNADRFVEACRAPVQDPEVRRLSLLGSIDQFGDSTDLLSDVTGARRVAGSLRAPLTRGLAVHSPVGMEPASQVHSSYISPKATKGERSRIEGRGLFAREPIVKDEVVAIKGGHIVSTEALTDLAEDLRESEIQITDSHHLVASSTPEYEPVMLFLNHSCNPNIGVGGSTVFVAMRDVAAGEELTTDYALFDDSESVMECRCGEPGCRRFITGKDWQRPDLQRRYAGYFSWYLQRRMNPEAGMTR